MVIHGKVQNGVIIVQPGVHLPEGLDVIVKPVEARPQDPSASRSFSLRNGVPVFPPRTSDVAPTLELVNRLRDSQWRISWTSTSWWRSSIHSTFTTSPHIAGSRRLGRLSGLPVPRRRTASFASSAIRAIRPSLLALGSQRATSRLLRPAGTYVLAGRHLAHRRIAVRSFEDPGAPATYGSILGRFGRASSW